PHDRLLPVPLLREGQPADPAPTLHDAREHLTTTLATLPRSAFGLSSGAPTLPTRFTPDPLPP
ncbi:MAG TPA: nicotinate phosphoribosyltransferase, partial [Pseudonocardiaceae bacterium]|nr:nicotinate phosphoribosyltransferase [Pseudonocardiaceae bacterium]